MPDDFQFLTPEMAQALIPMLAQAGQGPAQSAIADRQLQIAERLRGGGQNFAGIGGLLGGAGNVLNAYTARQREKEALAQQAKIQEQGAQTSRTYGEGLMKILERMQGQGTWVPPQSGGMPGPGGV